MTLMYLIQWWYGHGWMGQLASGRSRIAWIIESFSVGILARTLFDPWKQIISFTGRDASLDMKFRAGVDNFVSRIVGVLVRLCVLIAASVCVLFSLLLSIALFAVWPLIPIVPIGLVLVSLGVRL